MPEGPGAVAGGALGRGQPTLAFLVLVHQFLGRDQHIDTGGFHVDQRLLGVGQVTGTVVLLLGQAAAGSRVQFTKQFRGLVQQRHVRLGPRRTGRPEQQGTLGRAEAGGAGLQDGWLAQQLPHQLLRGHRHPAQVQGHADVPRRADVLGEVGAVGVVADAARLDQLGHLLGQFAQQDFDEGDPGLVVRFPGGTCLVPGTAHLPGGQHEFAAVHLEDPVFRRDPLPVGDGVGHDLGHVEPALDRRDIGVVLGDGVDAGHQPAQAGHDDAGLTQGRQHPFDVVHKRRGRAHQQHAGCLEPVPVGVEQVGGTVQGHGGLARAGAALDHQRAGDGGADDPVLLGLDGADDIRHPAGALGIQRGEQRPFALQGVVVRQQVGVEHVVLDGLDLAALQDQVPAAANALPVEGGGLVEVAGLGGAPVDHQALQVLGGQADAPDVLGLTGVQVEASKHEAVVDGVELGEAVLVECGKRVPLRDVLHGAHGAGAADLGQLGALFRPQLIQPGVQAGHIVAFMGQISVVHRAFPYRKRQTNHSTAISVISPEICRFSSGRTFSGILPRRPPGSSQLSRRAAGGRRRPACPG